jgi:hypothetical protein
MGSISFRKLHDDIGALRAVVSDFQGHSHKALTAAELVGVLDERCT